MLRDMCQNEFISASRWDPETASDAVKRVQDDDFSVSPEVYKELSYFSIG